ncbi:MAG: ATP-dependent Clp protease adaptor ClpS, partial [Alphaproteobacteria bacterium]
MTIELNSRNGQHSGIFAQKRDEDLGPDGNSIVLEPKAKVKKPSMYKVLMLNDDYTPMEFVIDVLEHF